MDLNEARDLVNDAELWPLVRDAFLRDGEFRTYPRGDLRRLELLDAETRDRIDRWRQGLAHVSEWRNVLDRDGVRKLKADYPDVYPEVFRYAAYFARFSADGDMDSPEALKLLLKLKFPEAYGLCCS